MLDRLTGSGRPTDKPVDVVLWTTAHTKCEDHVGEPPVLTTPPDPGEKFTPSEGQVGYDHAYGEGFVNPPWVSEQIVDVDAASFSLDDFIAGGAFSVGSREARVLLVNRTDEPMAVVDMGVEVVRRPVPTGTLAYSPGGDPSPILTISFDLKQTAPVARVVNDDCDPSAPFFDRYFFEVAPKTSDVVHVRLDPGDCFCLVRLKIKYRLGGEWKELTVPEPGKDAIPVVTGGVDSGHKYRMIYIDNSFLSKPNEKYDCARSRTPPC
ncbi:MAG TPA: hypothetical protein VF062_20775 [Candidatus Limnocylindrales bacterium]